MTESGEGAIWNGHGVGTMRGDGMGASFAFSATVQTNGEKLARLNGVLMVGEHRTDNDGQVHSSFYEWKA
jgi:hypothetical protein